MILRALSIALFVCAVAGCSPVPRDDRPPEITVFAAASLITALDAIAADFEALHDADVTISYAASAQLAQQIMAGADPEVFISASVEWADTIAETVRVVRREDALGNSLVLVVPRANPAAINLPEDLMASRVSRVAIGEPASVPAGNYAREAFTKLGFWNAVRSKAVYTMDVRQALLYAERAEVDAAVVYATDAAASDEVSVVAALDDALASPVLYSFVLLETDPPSRIAGAFFDYLLSQAAETRFAAAGFERLSLGGAS